MKNDVLDVTACTCANLRKASRLVTQIFDASLRDVGMKPTQFTLLATLDKTGELPLTQLADVMVTERTTLTRNLAPLKTKGYVSIVQDGDHRVRRIQLTKEGQAALKKARPAWERAQTQIVDQLGGVQWESLLTELTTTIDVFQHK